MPDEPVKGVEPNVPKPQLGEQLAQLTMGIYGGIESKVYGECSKLLGVFNPRAIGTDARLLMRLDPDVAFANAILRAPIVNLRWTVDSPDPACRAFVEQELRRTYRKLAQGGSMALHFGLQVLGKVWAVEPREVELEGDGGTSTVKKFPNALVVKKFKAIDPRTISILLDPKVDDWVGVEQTVNGKPVLVDKNAVVLWSFRREEVWGDIHGFPLSDQGYESWWFKQLILLAGNKYFERRGEPPYKARGIGKVALAGGLEVDGFKYLADQVAALKAGGVFVVPALYDEKGNPYFDLEPIQDDKRGDMFQAYATWLGIQILRAYWISDKAATSAEGDGSLAMAQQHADVLAQSLESIQAEWLDDVLNEQYVFPLVLYNFGPELAAKTTVKAAGISKDMKTLLKDVMLALLTTEQELEDGKRASLADRLNLTAIAEALDLPLRDLSELPDPAAQPDDEDDAVDPDATEQELEDEGSLDPEDPGKKRPPSKKKGPPPPPQDKEQ